MTVKTTTAQLAAFLRLVPNPDNTSVALLAFVHENIPRVLQDANCPCAVLFPAEAAYSISDLGNQTLETARRYRIVVFIENALYGTASQGQVIIAPFFDAIADYIVARPGLPLSTISPPRPVVGETSLVSDEGYSLTEYPIGSQKLYHSIEFVLEVIEIENIVYAD